jgi:hypothetical protein
MPWRRIDRLKYRVETRTALPVSPQDSTARANTYVSTD